MKILLTNDDGIGAPGLAALYEALLDLGEVVVVAPSTVQSATSHAVTFHRPVPTWTGDIRTHCGRTLGQGVAVEGWPADCVKIGLSSLNLGPFDVVVSGMNAGANVGVNVLYSGTVAAAREAAIFGLPALAVSLHIGQFSRTRWRHATDAVKPILGQLLRHKLDPHTLLNLNVPILDDADQPRGWRVAPLSSSPLADLYHAEQDAEGRRCFRADSGMRFRHMPPDSDVSLLFEGFGTLTPLRLDTTDVQQLQRWESALAAESVTS
ncbi:MAG: 5'/3'-nucleotidase SurE [Phycisphaeraceae bacterium]|nr:5'/3'-nucleotidase SurE [Phycisphaeraceae bacterium]